MVFNFHIDLSTLISFKLNRFWDLRDMVFWDLHLFLMYGVEQKFSNANTGAKNFLDAPNLCMITSRMICKLNKSC